MTGKHPSPGEGVVQRIVCFSSGSDPCTCVYTSLVDVQKCGDHYVYRIKSVPKCNARYCMTKREEDTGRPMVNPTKDILRGEFSP